MKKIVFWVLIVLICAISVGCNSGETGQNNNTNLDVNEEDDMGYNTVQMTDEEKKILCSIYVNEDRINEGKLHDYQLEALMQFRSANAYLEEKYPGYEFYYYSFKPKDKMNEFTLLEFTVDDTEHYFAVKVEVEEEGYVITDNLCGYIVKPMYDEMLTEKFKAAGLDNLYVYSKIGGYVGKEMDINTTIDDMLATGKGMKKDVEVYVDMSFEDEEAKQKVLKLVEDELRALDNYGAHCVYFVPGIMEECSSGAECIEYRKKNKLNFIQFNTFDL